MGKKGKDRRGKGKGTKGRRMGNEGKEKKGKRKRVMEECCTVVIFP